MKSYFKFARALAVTTSLLALSQTLRAGVEILASPGFDISWDGNEADHFSIEEAAPAPANLANAVGASPIASGELMVGPHYIPTLNDGLYGNTNSWIGGNEDVVPFAGINLGGLKAVTSFAFGRDNGNNVTDPQANGYLGQLPDRCLGFYTVQFTQVANPDAATGDTGDAVTGWQTIGTLDYVSNDDAVPGEEFTAYYRHEFEIANGTGGIQATGLRLLVPATGIGAGTAIDEIEVYGPSVVNPDADGDGFDDTFEVANGFDPKSALSTPESRSDIFQAVEFRFFAAKFRTYRIESSTDLQTWARVEADVIGKGAEVARLFNTRSAPKTYYRAVRVTAPNP